MLEGLEAVEVDISTVLKNENFRLESEFYTALSFSSKDSFTGEDITSFVQYGTSNELNEDGLGYPVLRLNEFDTFFISTPSKYCDLIDENKYQTLKLTKNDVLICRTNGNPKLVGKSAIVAQNYDYAYASYLFKIRPIESLINAATLVTFLNSKFGRMEIEKFSMASNQVNFSPAKFRQMQIPKFSKSFCSSIEQLVYASFSHIEKSKPAYKKAETLLLQTLGLANFSPSSEQVNIKSFKDSFGTSGRLDAEYYQPKYEQVVSQIKRLPWQSLGYFIDNYSTGYPYKSEDYIERSELPLIRINNIKKGFLDITNAAFLPEVQKHLSEKDIANENDLLISMSGTIGNTCVVPMGITAVVNQRIMRLTPKNYNPLVLMLIINSIVGSSQLERIGTGGVQTNISSGDISQIIIPALDMNTQQEIATLIQQSFTLKAQSEHLLDVAKRAVEIAIEQDEQTAMDYINVQMGA